jgi:antitoxin MazE5
MTRVRLSTTVDEALLAQARQAHAGVTDAVLVDEALGALVARNRGAQIDAEYKRYDEHPLDEPDEWGDLASFRQATGAS